MVDHDWGARRDECNLPGSAESKRRARQRSCDGTGRMTRECQIRICEGLGVKFPGPTRHNPNPPSALACQLLSPAADIPLHWLWAAMAE
jgi:hypothetical protein